MCSPHMNLTPPYKWLRLNVWHATAAAAPEAATTSAHSATGWAQASGGHDLSKALEKGGSTSSSVPWYSMVPDSESMMGATACSDARTALMASSSWLSFTSRSLSIDICRNAFVSRPFLRTELISHCVPECPSIPHMQPCPTWLRLAAGHHSLTETSLKASARYGNMPKMRH